MRTLQRKLIRDLTSMWAQALAVSLVMASGIAISVMAWSTLRSLSVTRDTYYDRYRFAHVFANVRRAPEWVADDVRLLEGVAAVDTRIVHDVNLIVPGIREPAVARLISVPDRGASRLNQIYLRRGRMPQQAPELEVLVGESFAVVHRLNPGDSLEAILNGRLRRLLIVGVALSPEYVLTVRTGEMLPDAQRFGVFWTLRTTLEAAFDSKASFNDLTVRLMPGAQEKEVIRKLDQLLDPWGNVGSYGRDEQVSARYVTDEIRQLRGTGTYVPLVFIFVSAFLLNIVLSRVIGTQREQIAALKAFGYTSQEIAIHYLQFVTVIAIGGLLIGVLAGTWMGSGLTQIYTRFYRFPFFYFELDVRSTLIAGCVCFVAGYLGCLNSVWKAVRLHPAEAMRPEPPARYQLSLLEPLSSLIFRGQAMRMILRNIERRPMKSLVSCVGIALATSVLVTGSFGSDALEFLVSFQFHTVQRDDVTVTLYEPSGSEVIHEFEKMPGVIRAEGFRALPVRLRSGALSRRLALLGLSDRRELLKLYDDQQHEVSLPPQGLLLSEALAALLDVQAGDTVQVEVLEGHRPSTEIRVAGLIRDYTGTNAYISAAEMDRVMQEQSRVSGVWLLVDSHQQESLYTSLKHTPGIASVTVREATIQSFLDTIAENQLILRSFNVAFACIIAFGVVYNTARIALAERSRELATLRVIGFTTREVAVILLGELAVFAAAAIPAGLALGTLFSWITSLALQTEMYRIPLIISGRTYIFSAMVTVIASVVSGIVVVVRVGQLDMIGVLKSRE